jgi:N-acetylglucosaminyldiphosphoundecaprenol N-acetyl-beta-D-mannosaminyltransferase
MKSQTTENNKMLNANGRHDLGLRAFDIGLALLVGLLASPLVLLMLPGARLRRTEWLGRHEQIFHLIEIELASGIRRRLGARLHLCRAPVLLSILRGDLAWVGPRPLSPGEAPPPALRDIRASVRPGLFSLWSLRQRTRIDYGDEWNTDAEQIARRSLGHDLGILMRNLLASVYGRAAGAENGDPVLVDTVRVHPVTMDEALEAIDRRRAGPGTTPLQLCFVNPDCVNIARRNPAYRHAVNRAELVAPDGIGMRIAGKILGKGFRQNVNGTDLFPRLCERLARDGGRLYLLGGRPGVAEGVGDWIGRHHPGVAIAGLQHGYFDIGDQETVIDGIRASHADVLLVAMGAPRQDLWIQEHAARTGVKVAMGVGGLFDFYADRIPRAPQWLREIGLEWTFRLYQEPGRMWRRYLVGNFSFLTAVFLQRWLGSIDLALLAGEPAEAPPVHTATRAMVLATQPDRCDWVEQADMSPAMLPLGDRPMLYRQLETLAGLGCREVEVFASHGLEAIRALLGAGERWGLQVTVHAVRDFADARRRIARSDLATDESLWLLRADHWLPAPALQGAQDDAAWFSVDPEDRVQWAGWARISGHSRAGFLAAMGPDGLNLGGLPDDLDRIGTATPYRFDRGPAVLEAQRRWLARTPNRFELLQEKTAGIRIAPSARIAPGARMIAPLEVGENTYIAGSATLGPNVVLGEGCRVEGETTIRDALVADGVRIKGPAEVDQAIVTPAGLLHAAYDVWLPADATGDLLGTSATAGAPLGITGLERLAALLTLAVGFLPVLTLRLLGRGQDFSHRVFPQLPSVVRGECALVGIADHPELPESIHASGWSETLRKAPRGVVRPRDAFAIADPEAAAWADVHWLLHAGWKERLRLLHAYVRTAPMSRFTVPSQSPR